MLNINKKAFTLVELIVVITILAILGTIGFISLQGYSSEARDSKRITDLGQIRTGLEIEQAKEGVLPMPTESILIGSGSINLLVQGKAGKEVLNTIGVSENAIDPLEKTHYTYTTNSAKTKYQLLGLLENNLTANNINNVLLPTTYANYETRIPYVIGNKLGVLVKPTINTPLNELGLNIDLSTDTTPYKIIFSRQEEKTSFGESLYINILANINNNINTKKFAIYYGYPSSLNSSTNGYRMDNVINDLNKYDVIYLGKGLEKETHPDYDNLKILLDGSSPGELWYSPDGLTGYTGKTYGYVTLLDSYSTIIESINGWNELGVDGIFLDESGYDFLVGTGEKQFLTEISARDHQNNVIDYIHSLGINTIINSWVIDDVLGTNYGEANTTLNSNDSFLMESFVYNFLNVGNNYYDYDNQLSKLNKAIEYRNNLGIKLYCVGLLPNSSLITSERIEEFYNKSNSVCDFAQITEQSFGTDSPILIDYLSGFID